MITAKEFVQAYTNASRELRKAHRGPFYDNKIKKIFSLISKQEKILQDFSDQCAKDGLPLVFTEATICLFNVKSELELLERIMEIDTDGGVDIVRWSVIDLVKRAKKFGIIPNLEYTKIIGKLEKFPLSKTEKKETISDCIEDIEWNLKTIIYIQEKIIEKMPTVEHGVARKEMK